jgi:hypothetical protein
MKWLSIRQPWVFAIFSAGKPVENRDWKPWNSGLKIRGRVGIHASKGLTKREYEDFADFYADLPEPALPVLPHFDDLARGCLFGTVEIVDVVQQLDSPWFFGPYGLVLRDPKPLAKPVPYLGQLGFFDVPERLWKELVQS